jgi:hypothetical protein
MPVPTEFLRGLLGMIALGCAFLAGRSFIAVRKGWQKLSKVYGWVIRLTVCLAGVAFRHPIDTVDIVLWAVAVLAFAGGAFTASHAKPPEDLTHEIFPDR